MATNSLARYLTIINYRTLIVLLLSILVHRPGMFKFIDPRNIAKNVVNISKVEHSRVSFITNVANLS